MTTPLWVRSLDFAGPGVPQTAGFYRELWKLHDAAGGHNAGTYLRGSGNEPYLLGLHPGDRKGLVRITLGVPDRASLEAMRASIAAQGVAASPVAPLTTPGGGVGFEVQDPENRTIRFSAEVAVAEKREAPDDPMRLSHIVLNSASLERTQAFFTEVLGFKVSDWSEDQMVFLRCHTDHHSIALNRADHASVNHVAFELPSIDAYMRGIGRLKSGGYPLNWGPGRHGPGDNVFAYWIGPSGFVIEYTTALEQVPGDREPRVWQRTAEQSDRWMLAGPPSRQIRAAMAGDPDSGHPPGRGG
jgi:catechol-2,3-dioxygenase